MVLKESFPIKIGSIWALAARRAGPVPIRKLLYLGSNQYGNLLEIGWKRYKVGIIFPALTP
jgi:hypothetical protein